MQTVKDLSVEELRAVIGEVVEEELREILSDPDAGHSGLSRRSSRRWLGPAARPTVRSRQYSWFQRKSYTAVVIVPRR